MTEKKILLIEDDSRLREGLLVLLKSELNLDADWAGSTKSALRLLTNGAYDVVVSDNKLPRFGDLGDKTEYHQGLELLKWMRQEEKYRETPFIMHTGDDLPEVRQQVEELRGIFCPKGQLNPSLFSCIEEAMLAHT